MNILEYINNNLLFMDGGMGTLLQKEGLIPGELPERWNISHPEIIQNIHRAYYEAGSNVITTNTFGANILKFSREELEKIISAAIKNANAARDSASSPKEKFIALDIGPSGKLLKPYGDLDFEDAVSIFAETVKIGVKYGVDLILIETMNDSYETKAALLAAKENSSLPVFVSNAYGSDKRLMTGASPAAMVAMLEGMGADAIGANCSLGPKQLGTVVEELLQYASVPVLLMPNAGLPEIKNGNTVFNVSPKEFADDVKAFIDKGVRIVGGCCGTTPEYISAISELRKTPVEITYKEHSLVSSYTNAVEIGKSPILIGERINPTGKKLLKQALRENNLDYLLKEGIDQEGAGAHVLDVNVGLPDINEREMLKKVVCELQSVCSLPLQLDTANPLALEDALRRYNGKPMINSVNGTLDSMNTVFPLVKKYGGVCVALTLDENGIPENAEGRVEIAKKILIEAQKYGIRKKDIIFDALTMAVSASSAGAASVTLEALRRIRNELGANTVLGVSNISFGLPNRDILNSVFFANALEAGLSAAIMNPFSIEMMKVYHAHRALNSLDESFSNYIDFASKVTLGSSLSSEATQGKVTVDHTLKNAIVKGLGDKARQLAQEALSSKAPLEVVNQEIVPALDEVGRGFEAQKIYLPGLLMSAEAAKSAFEPIKAALASDKSANKKATIIIATVKGDIHDIGKNIVALLLENYGYNVIDLGRDVAPDTILDTVVKYNACIVALSALMTTTVPAMEETIKLLHANVPHVKVMVGGAVLTEEYSMKIGADFYGEDAMSAVRHVESMFG